MATMVTRTRLNITLHYIARLVIVADVVTSLRYLIVHLFRQLPC